MTGMPRLLAMRSRRIRPAIFGGVLALALAVGGATQAQTFRVDDSKSQVLDTQVRMQWESVAPGPGRSATVVGQTTVLVRLDVAEWQGLVGRIFMRLPARPDGAVEVRWTTRGRLQPGSLRSGERAMVFSGVVPAALLEDTLVIRLSTDGESLDREEALEFSFEIEVD
jgi:hypothetical protein